MCVLYLVFFKTDIKRPLIQSDRGINTIPNLIDPLTKSFNYTPPLSIAPCTPGKSSRGNNLFFPPLQNKKAITQWNMIMEYHTRGDRQAAPFSTALRDDKKHGSQTCSL